MKDGFVKAAAATPDIRVADVAYNTENICKMIDETVANGAKVIMVTKLRIGDANTMMAEGGIQAADKPNDSPAQHFLDAYGGGHFAAQKDLLSAPPVARMTVFARATSSSCVSMFMSTAPAQRPESSLINSMAAV